MATRGGHFLVPVRALSVRFRARFLAHLRRALPEVVVPPAVWRKPWVVYCKPTVQGSALVLRYLARYVHRVAISDARIQTITAEGVTFSYKDAERRQWRTMTLSGGEFLRRFLQHVLPRGFLKVRYYGLWRPAAAPLRRALQQQLAAPAATPPVERESIAIPRLDRSPVRPRHPLPHPPAAPGRRRQGHPAMTMTVALPRPRPPHFSARLVRRTRSSLPVDRRHTGTAAACPRADCSSG